MLEGRVSVNGEIVMELGTKIDPLTDRVEVDGKRVKAPSSFAYYVINKPRGYISTLDDPEGRPIITDLLPKRAPRVWPVGRLDWDSEGVMLLTNDGEITNLITHPSSETEKVYAVKIKGVVEPDDPAFDLFVEGVRDAESKLPMAARSARLFKTTKKHSWIEVTLTGGQNRQVRRMCAVVGWDVLRLRRILMAGITLKGVNQGDSRQLQPDEVKKLYKLFDKAPPDEAVPSKRESKTRSKKKSKKKK